MAYKEELAYQIELLRGLHNKTTAIEARRVLGELAYGIVTEQMSASERKSKTELLRGLAEEMRDDPELLEDFKWGPPTSDEFAVFYKENKSLEEIEFMQRLIDTREEIVRSVCLFLEPYLYITYEELQAKLKELRA
jgi:hypothetical protein